MKSAVKPVAPNIVLDPGRDALMFYPLKEKRQGDPLLESICRCSGLATADQRIGIAAPSATQAQFAAQTAGLVTTVETFSGFPLAPTILVSPVVLANGNYASSNPVVTNSLEFCGQPCMSSTDIDNLRTFSAFPAGATLWGAAVDMVSDSPIDNTIHIEVVGNGGIALDVNDAKRFSVTRPLGFSPSVFQNVTLPSSDVAGFNYSFELGYRQPRKRCRSLRRWPCASGFRRRGNCADRKHDNVVQPRHIRK